MFGLSKKEKEEKRMRANANNDAQMIYKKINTIMHHYSIGLSMYEQIAYYTLCVAYGNRTHLYPDAELKHLRDKLYFSNLTAQMGSSQRGAFGLQYDQLFREHMEFLNINGIRALKDRIKTIIETNNEIFPEFPKAKTPQELAFIEQTITGQFSNNVFAITGNSSLEAQNAPIVKNNTQQVTQEGLSENNSVIDKSSTDASEPKNINALSDRIEKLEADLSFIRQKGYMDAQVVALAKKEGLTPDSLSQRIKAEIVSLQREYNAQLKSLKQTADSSLEYYIIDTFDEQKRASNLSIGDEVEINIEKRLAQNSRWAPRKQIGSTVKYALYYIDGCLIGKDKTTNKAVYLGRIGFPAAIYHEYVFWFDEGNGMSSPNYIRERRIGEMASVQFDWLSNELTTAAAHCVTEDSVEEMDVEGDTLVIQVRRRGQEGGQYSILVKENSGAFEIKRVIVSGPMTRLRPNPYIELLKEHLQNMRKIYADGQMQTCAKMTESEAQAEMAVALFSIIEYSCMVKKENRNQDIEAVYREMQQYTASSSISEADLQRRINEYRDVLNGRQPRGECLFESDWQETFKNPIYRAVTMMCDFFINPGCANGYFEAQKVILESDEISDFVVNIYRPIGWEMNGMFLNLLSLNCP